MDNISDIVPELTKKQLYAEVKAAIHAILTTGQSYTIGSRTLTRANITELRHLLDSLEAQIAAEENSSPLLGGTYVGIFDGR